MLIGEVAERTGISTRMLRHYDRIGLVLPSGRTSSGYRKYSDDDLRQLFRVEGLRLLGLGLAEIPSVINDERHTTNDMVDQLLDRARTQFAQAQELLARLEHVRAAEPEAWPDVMRTIGLLRGFDGQDASIRQRHALSVTNSDPRDVGVLVEAALRETDPNVAGAIHWAIVRAGDRAIPLLESALNAPSAERRHRALETLEKIDSPTAQTLLANAVDHKDPRIRSRAHLASGRSGEASSISSIVELVALGCGDIEAAEVLQRLASEYRLVDAVVQSISTATASTDAPGRCRLAAALVSLPGDEATEALNRLTNDPERSVSLTAKALHEQRRPAQTANNVPER